MNDTLTEQINLPKIGGRIVAFLDMNNSNVEILERLREFLSLMYNADDSEKEFYTSEYRRIHLGLETIFGDKTGQIINKVANKRRFYGKEDYWDTLKEIFPDDLSICYSGNWRLEFVVSGPDSRYLPATIILTAERVDNLIKSINYALEKIKKLQMITLDSSYSKKINSFDPILEIIMENRKTILVFWFSSKNWRYSRRLTISETEDVLEKLKLVNKKGLKLSQNLESLCF